MKPPSERKLAEAERTLRRLPRGSQRAVGGGVYMRLDSDGRRRFQVRVRTNGQQGGSTFDSWREAYDEQQRLTAPRPTPPAPAAAPAALPSFDMSPGPGTVIGPTAEQMRQMRFRDYRKYVYWPWAKVNLAELTLVDYRRKLRNDVEPTIGDYTLAQLVESPLLVDHFKDELAKRKRYPKTRRRKGKKEKHPKAGQVEKAAADGAIRAASSVMKHALEKHVVSRNPFQGIPRFNRKKTARGTSNASYERVKQPVPVKWVEDAVTRLLADGEIEVSVASLGYRSAFVGAVLLQIPSTTLVQSSPPRIRLTRE